MRVQVIRLRWPAFYIADIGRRRWNTRHSSAVCRYCINIRGCTDGVVLDTEMTGRYISRRLLTGADQLVRQPQTTSESRIHATALLDNDELVFTSAICLSK